MSLAFAVSTKNYGIVFSEGRAWKDGKIDSDEWDKTFKFTISDRIFLGCHTGILVIQNKKTELHIEEIINNCNGLTEDAIITKIEQDFSNILENIFTNEFGTENNIVDLLIIMPSKIIVGFNFVIDCSNLKVASKTDYYKPNNTIASAVIGEDKPANFIKNQLRGFKSFRFNDIKTKSKLILKSWINLSEKKENGSNICGGNHFCKY